MSQFSGKNDKGRVWNARQTGLLRMGVMPWRQLVDVHKLAVLCIQRHARRVQLTAALERVRAGADVMPRRQLEQVLVDELGDGWRAKVAVFEDEPLAAASIGQARPEGGLWLQG